MIRKVVNTQRRPSLSHRILKSAALSASLLVAAVFAQNPVPQVVGPVHPMAVAPGSGAFTLSVFGANFVPGAVVNWNYQPRVTLYISAHELQAQILATDIVQKTAAYITVANPAPGGGNSSASWAQVEVHSPVSTITVNPPAYYLFGFWQLQAADFNHDAILDLIGEYGSSVGLDIGNGNGVFHHQSIAGRHYDATTEFSYGDFNGDGNLDVMLVQGAGIGQPTHMGISLGDGKGNFSTGTSITSYDGLGLVVVGDFNRDGKLDLITKGQNAVAEFLGNGDGTFQHVANYPYSELTTQILAGDINGDGKLDLLLLEVNSSGVTVWFLQGNGDGTFQAPLQADSFPGENVCTGGAFSNRTLQLTDFNGDGKLDLAFCTQSQVGIMLGNGDGTFQSAVFYTADSTGQGQFTYSIGDINSDGKPDLLVSEYQGNFGSTFAVLLGNGDGTFQSQQTISLSQAPLPELGITVGDFNKDGLIDLIFLSDLGMDVFIQQ
jgi:hypothetical protein